MPILPASFFASRERPLPQPELTMRPFVRTGQSLLLQQTPLRETGPGIIMAWAAAMFAVHLRDLKPRFNSKVAAHARHYQLFITLLRRQESGNGLPKPDSAFYIKENKMRICTKCKISKNDSEFYSHWRDGHNRWCKDCCREWKLANSEKMKSYREKYNLKKGIKSKPRKLLSLSERQNNKRERRRRNFRKRWLEPMFRLNSNISRRIRQSIASGKQNSSWQEVLGFSLNKLKAHLEIQFSEGMSWDNYGEWHIDHIKPIAFFCFNNITDQDFKDCWALQNLRPLWASENVRRFH